MQIDFDTLFDWNLLTQSGLRCAVILLVGWLAWQAFKAASRRLERRLLERAQSERESPWESQRRVETLSRLLRQAVRVVIVLSVVLALLMEIGIQVGPLIASAGVVGLAVGFGAQNLVRDVISGFFLILENQVRIGDVAVVNGTGGLVERVNFRTLVLRDLSGVVHVFPNGAVTTLSNMTRGWSGYLFDLNVSYRSDIDHAIATIRAVGKELRADETYGPLMLDDVELYGVEKLADSAVVLRGRLKTLPIRQWDVGREFNRRIKYAFDREGIEIPFPHRKLYLDEQSPLLRLLAQGGGSGSHFSAAGKRSDE